MGSKAYNRVLLTICLSLLCGCRVGPNHYLPEIQIDDDWDQSGLDHNTPASLEELFDDPILLRYLDTLERDNPDLCIAQTRIFQAYAQRRMTAAQLLPSIDMNIAPSGADPAGGSLTGNPANSAATNIPFLLKQTSFLANFDALWEIDLFGKTQRQIEGDSAMIGRACASYDFTLLSLKSECARVYFTLRQSQELLRLTQQQTSLLKRKRDLSRARFANGVDAETALLQTENQLEQLEAQIPDLESAILVAGYQLSVLLGKTPQTLRAELEGSAEAVPFVQGPIPTGFPSELLRRRPDIRMAEKELAKASADVGVAVAQLFPQLTLNGSYGYQNLTIGRAKGDGKSWSYSAGLLTPLFHGGALRANIRLSEWERKEAFLNYENSVLKALQEAEGAIAQFTAAQKALQRKQKALQKEERLIAHAKQLFREGLSNELTLLDQEQELLTMRKDLSGQRLTVITNLIALYKALGGGFSAE